MRRKTTVTPDETKDLVLELVLNCVLIYKTLLTLSLVSGTPGGNEFRFGLLFKRRGSRTSRPPSL
ncbi:hypothetical protein POPTR_015G072666v4 [Populus trichocarpa]|uniref:Uncharacterized protein n=1 Tax=Populus trichocarpa TaxID=3694 RepID=A0ACC0RVP6_POPTR|nr:hypothetical protein POPTR_015G072666v4 [Populus trichocarpa]